MDRLIVDLADKKLELIAPSPKSLFRRGRSLCLLLLPRGYIRTLPLLLPLFPPMLSINHGHSHSDLAQMRLVHLIDYHTTHDLSVMAHLHLVHHLEQFTTLIISNMLLRT